MKLTTSIFTCLAAAHAICAQEPTAGNVGSAKDTLIQIERAWADALVKGDVATWSRCWYACHAPRKWAVWRLVNR
jgi:hypothetical protein